MIELRVTSLSQSVATSLTGWTRGEVLSPAGGSAVTVADEDPFSSCGEIRAEGSCFVPRLVMCDVRDTSLEGGGVCSCDVRTARVRRRDCLGVSGLFRESTGSLQVLTEQQELTLPGKLQLAHASFRSFCSFMRRYCSGRSKARHDPQIRHVDSGFLTRSELRACESSLLCSVGAT